MCVLQCFAGFSFVLLGLLCFARLCCVLLGVASFCLVWLCCVAAEPNVRCSILVGNGCKHGNPEKYVKIHCAGAKHHGECVYVCSSLFVIYEAQG